MLNINFSFGHYFYEQISTQIIWTKTCTEVITKVGSVKVVLMKKLQKTTFFDSNFRISKRDFWN